VLFLYRNVRKPLLGGRSCGPTCVGLLFASPQDLLDVYAQTAAKVVHEISEELVLVWPAIVVFFRVLFVAYLLGVMLEMLLLGSMLVLVGHALPEERLVENLVENAEVEVVERLVTCPPPISIREISLEVLLVVRLLKVRLLKVRLLKVLLKIVLKVVLEILLEARHSKILPLVSKGVIHLAKGLVHSICHERVDFLHISWVKALWKRVRSSKIVLSLLLLPRSWLLSRNLLLSWSLFLLLSTVSLLVNRWLRLSSWLGNSAS